MAQTPPCPYCGALSYKLHEKRWLVCQECGQEFDIRRDVCPSCGHLNRAGVTACSNCQSGLRQDTADKIIETRTKTRKQWREEYVAVAVEQKKQEQAASQQRMDEFWAEEQARREKVARARAEAREHERRVLITVGIVSGAIIVLLILAAILVALFKQPPEETDELAWMPTMRVKEGNYLLGALPRCTIRTCPSRHTAAPAAMIGRSGYSRFTALLSQQNDSPNHPAWPCV